MNRNPIEASILIVCCLLILYGVIHWQWHKDNVWTNDAWIEGYSIDLSTNVTEKIVALYVDEGDTVTAGQPIAQLEDNVPQARRAAAQARITSASEELCVKKAYFEKIRNDYHRAAVGIEEHVISTQDYDHSEKNLKIAQAEVQLAIAGLELAQRELAVIEAELSHYRIVAPQDGVIAKRWVWVGNVTTPGQSLFTMYDLDNVWVTANLEEGKLEGVRVGNSVEIKIDAYPNYTFWGHIFTIKGAAASQFSLIPQNNATGNYTKVAQRIPIKITIARPTNFPKEAPLYLFPGMSAEVTIQP